MREVVWDVETSTLNKGHPFNPLNKLVSYALRSTSNPNVLFQYYSDPGFIGVFKDVMATADVVIGFNVKFDLHWATRYNVVCPLTCRVWDCSLAEFVISGQTARFASLNDTLASYNLPVKHDKVKEYWDAGIDTADIPVAILEEYNKHDVYVTKLLYDTQQAIMSDKQKQLVWLMGEDLKTLQHAEFNGIKWDEGKANEKLDKYQAEVAAIEYKLNEHLPAISHGTWNWDSGDHLSAFLYGGEIAFDYSISEEAIYKSGANKGQAYTRNRWFVEQVVLLPKFKPLEGSEVKKSVEASLKEPTKAKIYQTDAPTISQLKSRKASDREIIVLLQERSTKIKIVEMIESIQKVSKDRGWENNYLHPQFNQNIAITGRLSSSQPNMQNTPPEIDELLVSRYDS